MFLKSKIITAQESVLETTLKAGLINLLIGAAALVLDAIFEIPPLPIDGLIAFSVFLFLIIAYALLLVWSAFALISARKKNQLAKQGPYAFCRHPMYTGIVLFINPALAIIFKSWTLLEVCVILYFIWKYFAKQEEKQLTESFGDEYKNYCDEVGCFLPKVC